MADRPLTPAEESFVNSFRDSEASEAAEDQELVQAHRRDVRSSRLFWSVISFLLLMPFIISAGLLITLSQYDGVFGNESLKIISETLTGREVQVLGKNSGAPQLATMVELYTHRYLIVGLVFLFFFGNVAIIFALRKLLRRVRN